MIKIDLHTHSETSPDGGITLDQYQEALNGLLDYIAITDHNQIDFALQAQRDLGDKIIVGEEIMTNSGEIIGLFLTSRIAPHQSLSDTIKQIKSQNGIVYVPHPFEKVRSGVSITDLSEHVRDLDIVESINGRAFFGNKSSLASNFAKKHNLATATSSDSHGWCGWGRTYSVIDDSPTRDNLVEQLVKAGSIYKNPRLGAILYPKYNRIRKALS